MKLTKSQLEQIIQEEAQKTRSELTNYTRYEEEDISTDQQMITLLQEILQQLKVLNQQMSPAKSYGSSAIEKFVSDIHVAEE